VKKVLYGGRVLSPDQSLAHYAVQKEASLQLMGCKRVAPPEDDALPPDLQSPAFARQFTAPAIQFGDVLVVDVLEAQELVNCILCVFLRVEDEI